MIKFKFPKIKLSKVQLITIIIIGGLFVLVGLGFLGYKLFLGKSSPAINVVSNANTNTEETENKPCFRRKIDGVCLESEEKNNLYPVAIMVENMVDAWPLSGLDKANLVIEAPVEAGIPRFLAVYASGDDISQIGPVRSARPYYLDWAEEFSALYLHVGGSPEALNKIKKYNIYDLNQFFADKYFWRGKSRLAPHNVYTSSDLIGQALSAKDLDEVAYESWLYKDEAELADRPLEAKDLIVDFSTPTYRATWKYNSEANDYLRYENGNEQKMLDGGEIRAKNIAVQIANIQILDDIGRRRITTIGEGKSLVFLDGKVILGKWKKERRGARTKFYDSENKEIEFNGGTTWIEVVPDMKLISY
jgi:hypothetical protein